MAKVVEHGDPGEWAKTNGTVKSLYPVFICLMLTGGFVASAVLGSHVEWFLVGLALSVAFLVVFWRNGIRRIESYFVGARGEEKVAAELRKLPDEYHVFHDYVAGRHHVDHIVVGPTGVFTIETKNWRNPVTVEDGYVLYGKENIPSKNPVRQALAQNSAVMEKLRGKEWTGDVTPILCFASNTFTSGLTVVDRVHVMNLADIVAWIAHKEKNISSTDVERLVKLMII